MAQACKKVNKKEIKEKRHKWRKRRTRKVITTSCTKLNQKFENNLCSLSVFFFFIHHGLKIGSTAKGYYHCLRKLPEETGLNYTRNIELGFITYSITYYFQPPLHLCLFFNSVFNLFMLAPINLQCIMVRLRIWLAGFHYDRFQIHIPFSLCLLVH